MTGLAPMPLRGEAAGIEPIASAESGMPEEPPRWCPRGDGVEYTLSSYVDLMKSTNARLSELAAERLSRLVTYGKQLQIVRDAAERAGISDDQDATEYFKAYVAQNERLAGEVERLQSTTDEAVFSLAKAGERILELEERLRREPDGAVTDLLWRAHDKMTGNGWPGFAPLCDEIRRAIASSRERKGDQDDK